MGFLLHPEGVQIFNTGHPPCERKFSRLHALKGHNNIRIPINPISHAHLEELLFSSSTNLFGPFQGTMCNSIYPSFTF